MKLMFANDQVITSKGSQLKTGCNIKLIHIFEGPKFCCFRRYQKAINAYIR